MEVHRARLDGVAVCSDRPWSQVTGAARVPAVEPRADRVGAGDDLGRAGGGGLTVAEQQPPSEGRREEVGRMGEGARTDVFEVFRQEKDGDPMRHAGNVVAPDIELATHYA